LSNKYTHAHSETSVIKVGL